jgi:hypothetical protein
MKIIGITTTIFSYNSELAANIRFYRNLFFNVLRSLLAMFCSYFLINESYSSLFDLIDAFKEKQFPFYRSVQS